jgi:pimeloyl-ACP methyl ester carboxylesterase
VIGNFASKVYNLFKCGPTNQEKRRIKKERFISASSRIKCPALVLFSDRSHFFDVGQGVEFYRHLVDGELAVLPKCGHNTYEQQPEEYVRHIL